MDDRTWTSTDVASNLKWDEPVGPEPVQAREGSRR